jgi:hypothetical protein
MQSMPFAHVLGTMTSGSMASIAKERQTMSARISPPLWKLQAQPEQVEIARKDRSHLPGRWMNHDGMVGGLEGRSLMQPTDQATCCPLALRCDWRVGFS